MEKYFGATWDVVCRAKGPGRTEQDFGGRVSEEASPVVSP